MQKGKDNENGCRICEYYGDVQSHKTYRIRDIVGNS